MLQIRSDRKALYRLIFTVTLPIVIQNLLNATVNMVDVVMLNAIGQTEMAAVSLASQAGNILHMFLYGLGTGMVMLGAQYWGKGDVNTIEKAQGIALRFAAVIGLAAMALVLLLPEPIMRIYTSDEVLVEMGAGYLRIFAFTVLFWAFSTVYFATLRSTGRVAVCTAVQVSTLLLNVALNALFLFVFRKGVAGVAIATVISRVIELAVCMVISRRSKTVHLNFRPMFERHPALQKDFTRLCVPAICNDLVWSIGFSAYSAILGHVSTDAVAAMSIVNVVRNLGSVLCFGLADATGIILGQILGAGKREEAISTSKVLMWLCVAAGVLGGGLIALATPLIVSRANLTANARDILHFMMIVNTVYLMGGDLNTTMIVGVFRAGGDSKFGLRCDLIDMWCYAVPLGLLAAFVFRLDAKLVYLLLCTDEFVKWPWVFRHYFSWKWAVNITRDQTE